MVALQASLDVYRSKQVLGAVAASAVAQQWSRVGNELDDSFAAVLPNMVAILTAAQTGAAAVSAEGVSKQLAQSGQPDVAAGIVNPEAFAGTASDGRSLDGLLYGAVAHAKQAIGDGAPLQTALDMGGRFLTLVSLTAVSDAGREAAAAGIAARPTVGGYVRMLNAPSCSRCVILAGKFYRWNEGFRRHNRCDCIHIPSSENVAGDLRTNPYEYFKALTPEQQEKTFGRIEARAIRDGADIYRVENISRGVNAQGQLRGLGTARGKRLYGTPTRMTVDDIYRTAGHRTNAIKMLEREGYITGPQTVGGNIIGQREGFGQLGKGGVARAASDAVTKARLTGVRDPMDRYTMTAAERRLYDAKVRVDMGRKGIYPRSIGANSADKYAQSHVVTPDQLATLERAYANELAKLKDAPKSVKTLARLLGIN